MEVINLNLIPTGALPVVHASQYDEGRTFRANLMDGSTVYTLDGTEVLECDVKKPDGNIVTVAVTNTSDSYVEIDTTLQMCACAGESLAELHITKGAQEIGTLNFILAVERSPLEGGIQSDSGIHNLQEQIGEAVAEQYAAEDVVFDAAPVAGHGTGFAVTSEGVKTYVEGEIAALTTNFGADYDENTTYNTGDKCVYNNLLYECNDDGVTGAWDATKWDSLTVASMTDNNLPHYTGTPTAGSTAEAIGDLSQLTTTDKSSIVGAVNEVCSYGGLHNTAETALDLNDLKTNDTANKAYHINMAYCLNAPANSGTCLLEVIKPASNGAMVLQRTTNYGSLGQTHIRFYLNSTWTNWVQTSS